MKALNICYLLLIPYSRTLHKKNELQPKLPKGAPYFYDVDIIFERLVKETVVTGNVSVEVVPEVLDEQVWLAECRFTLTDPFTDSAVSRLQEIESQLKEKYSGKYRQNVTEPIEEYTIVLASTEKTPLTFVTAQAQHLARLFRFSEKQLSHEEVREVVETRVHYSEKDLTVIDWNGAVIIAEDEAYDSDIELLKIGNYQLLRYRMLDQQLEDYLATIQKHLMSSSTIWFPRANKLHRELIHQRLSLLLAFEKINQSLLLIGDWYSAKVYRGIVDEFYLDEWKNAVSSKLENITSIYDVVSQNLIFSWSRFLDLIQIAGWFILLVGYFVLFFFDISASK